MSYRYYYHIRIDRAGMDGAGFIEQLRNEPMTARLYRDVIRWRLSDCCPWRGRTYERPLWVRARVFRVVGEFDEIPSGDERIYEDDMQQIAAFMWARPTGASAPIKYYGAYKQDGDFNCTITP